MYRTDNVDYKQRPPKVIEKLLYNIALSAPISSYILHPELTGKILKKISTGGDHREPYSTPANYKCLLTNCQVLVQFLHACEQKNLIM
jgi:hypothetical protein